MDNTLVDRTKSIRSYANQFLADFKTRLSGCSADRVSQVILNEDNGGYLRPDSPFSSIKEAISSALITNLPWNTCPNPNEIIEHWVRNLPHHAVEIPGASSLIEAIAMRGLPVAVASNGSHHSRLLTVKNLPFSSRITAILSSELVGKRKPAPAIFIAAAAALEVKCSECWHIGDHPINDIVGATRAGMRGIWVHGFHEWPSSEQPPEFSVSSLYEVELMLKSSP